MFGHRQIGTDMRVLTYRQNVRFWIYQTLNVQQVHDLYPHTVFGWLCWMSPFEYAASRPLAGREN